jgi:lipopolysaccharide transport system permease protein
VEASQALASARSVRSRKVWRIQPSKGLVPVDFGELWDYRALLYLFMWRDIKTRYRQSYLSGFWAIFRPLSQMVLFSLIFGGLAHIKGGNGVPYPLFVTPGVLAFTYFSSATANGVSAVSSNGALITKAYFPRLYAPFAIVTAPLVDFALAFVVLLGLFGYYQRPPSWHIIFLPFFLLLAVLLALSISLWLSGISVKYRDITFGIPFVLQLWMYLTPVIYPASFVPRHLRWLISVNPTTGVVDGFRWSMLGNGFPTAGALAASVGITLALLVPGLYQFRRTERTFADLI